MENEVAEENWAVTVDYGLLLRARCKIPLPLGAVMWDFEYVIELAKAYRRAEITRDELQDKIHSCSLKAAEFGVIIFSGDYGDEATADFVVAAGLPIFYQRVKPGPPAADFTIIEDDDEEPPGYWYVDTSDERVKDFPPE